MPIEILMNHLVIVLPQLLYVSILMLMFIMAFVKCISSPKNVIQVVHLVMAIHKTNV